MNILHSVKMQDRMWQGHLADEVWVVLLAGSERESSPWIVLVLVAIIASDSGRGGSLGLATQPSSQVFHTPMF